MGKDDTDQLTKIRLARPVVLRPYTQHRVLVSKLLKGVIMTEPKQDVMRKCGCRVMNSVHEVSATRPFEVLLTNFSAKERKLPKGMVVAYGSRYRVGLIHLTGQAAQEVLDGHGIQCAVYEAREKDIAESIPKEDVAEIMQLIKLVEDQLAYRRTSSPTREPDLHYH